MRKLFCLVLIVVCWLYAKDDFHGRWSFIFYESAASYDGLMPPPVFNEIEFREDGMAQVKIRSKDKVFELPYLVNEKYFGMKLPLGGPGEEPVRFKAEYAYSKEDGTLTIKGSNSSAVYVRTQALLPCSRFAGIWQNNGKFIEQMEILPNGFLKLRKTGLTGYCVFWKDNQGIENLTMVGGIKNAMPHTFIWQLQFKSENTLEMTPVTNKGVQKKMSTLWHRISSL